MIRVWVFRPICLRSCKNWLEVGSRPDIGLGREARDNLPKQIRESDRQGWDSLLESCARLVLLQ